MGNYNIFNGIKNYSLRKRLILAVMLCILLPWFFTYFVSNYLTKDLLEERAVKQSEDSLSMVEINLKNVFDDIMYVSNYIQFDTNFRSILNSYQSIDYTSQQADKKIALKYIEISNNLAAVTDLLSPAYITILLENGHYYMNYSINDYNPLDFYEETWFEELASMNFYQTKWIGTHPTYIATDEQQDPYLISVARNLQQANFQNTHVILSVKEKQIREYLMKVQNNTNSKYYLTDQQGTIFSSVDEKIIGESLPYDVNSSNYQVIKYNNQDHFLVSYPVSYSDWRLVTLVPYQETIGNINVMTMTTISIQGVFLLLFLTILILLVREMTKPIIELNTVTKSVQRGDFSRRTTVSGKSDMANLGSSFNHMLDTIEDMFDQIKIQEEEKREAELEMLLAQINPHFLFNVLNAIRMQLKLNGDEDSAQLIQSLSSLLRMTVNRNNPFVTLEQELEVIKNYTHLMNFRHQHEIELSIFLDKGSNEVEVPRFFLQPIIENAIIHGYSNGRGGSIVISSMFVDDHYLQLEITDDGNGMSHEKLEQLKRKIFSGEELVNKRSFDSFNGIGIQNVYQRMKMIYGDMFSMEVDSTMGIGTSFTFKFLRERE